MNARHLLCRGELITEDDLTEIIAGERDFLIDNRGTPVAAISDTIDWSDPHSDPLLADALKALSVGVADVLVVEIPHKGHVYIYRLCAWRPKARPDAGLAQRRGG